MNTQIDHIAYFHFLYLLRFLTQMTLIIFRIGFIIDYIKLIIIKVAAVIINPPTVFVTIITIIISVTIANVFIVIWSHF